MPEQLPNPEERGRPVGQAGADNIVSIGYSSINVSEVHCQPYIGIMGKEKRTLGLYLN